MSDFLKPIIDSTYPALMAGLCLTFIGISQNQFETIWLTVAVSTASLLFIISSFCIFAYSVNNEWGQKPTDYKSSKLWMIAKWSFFIGICLLLMSTVLVIYYLWLSDVTHWSKMVYLNASSQFT